MDNSIKKIRNVSRYSLDRISRMTDIPVERLKLLEAGEEGTRAELRDIAMVLHVSTRTLLNESIFENQAAITHHVYSEDTTEVTGFWGHIGILLRNAAQYLWFPISSYTYKSVVNAVSEQPYLCVPCMNNKVLYMNMNHVKDIILLDDDCDAPQYANWDSRVSNGEIPPVVYEVLDDHFYGDTDEMSIKFISALNDFDEDLSEEDVAMLTSVTFIYYGDGKVGHADIDFEHSYTNVPYLINMLYCFGEPEPYMRRIYYESAEGAFHVSNIDNVAMLEMPLLKLEDGVLLEKNKMEKELDEC